MTFSPSQFTPTQWNTVKDKAWFANQFVRFVQSGFDAKHFTDRFYRRLSNTFGHIAHYDRGGFWAEFFTTTADKVRFVEYALHHPCYGDPAWTYSDVERALQEWLRAKSTLPRYQKLLADEEAAREHAELERLQRHSR